MLLDVSRELSSLDDLTRLTLEDPYRISGLDPQLFPPLADADAGGFAGLAAKFAAHIQKRIISLPHDRGGRQNYAELLLGTAKTRFVEKAFEIFESYHPGTATSSEGSNFWKFVHLVYEHATGEHEEDRIAISHKIRSLITPLHQRRAVEKKLSAIDKKLDKMSPNDPERRALRERARKLDKRKRELEAAFTPLLGRVAKRQPRLKGGG